MEATKPIQDINFRCKTLTPLQEKVIGVRWNTSEDSYILISEPCLGPMLSFSGKMELGEAHIPMRYYNFLYALSVCTGHFENAIKYCRTHLFFNEKPINLQERISTIENSNLSKKTVQIGYGRILREAKQRLLNLTP